MLIYSLICFLLTFKWSTGDNFTFARPPFWIHYWLTDFPPLPKSEKVETTTVDDKIWSTWGDLPTLKVKGFSHERLNSGGNSSCLLDLTVAQQDLPFGRKEAVHFKLVQTSKWQDSLISETEKTLYNLYEYKLPIFLTPIYNLKDRPEIISGELTVLKYQSKFLRSALMHYFSTICMSGKMAEELSKSPALLEISQFVVPTMLPEMIIQYGVKYPSGHFSFGFHRHNKITSRPNGEEEEKDYFFHRTRATYVRKLNRDDCTRSELKIFKGYHTRGAKPLFLYYQNTSEVFNVKNKCAENGTKEARFENLPDLKLPFMEETCSHDDCRAILDPEANYILDMLEEYPFTFVERLWEEMRFMGTDHKLLLNSAVQFEEQSVTYMPSSLKERKGMSSTEVTFANWLEMNIMYNVYEIEEFAHKLGTIDNEKTSKKYGRFNMEWLTVYENYFIKGPENFEFSYNFKFEDPPVTILTDFIVTGRDKFEDNWRIYSLTVANTDHYYELMVKNDMNVHFVDMGEDQGDIMTVEAKYLDDSHIRFTYSFDNNKLENFLYTAYTTLYQVWSYYSVDEGLMSTVKKLLHDFPSGWECDKFPSNNQAVYDFIHQTKKYGVMTAENGIKAVIRLILDLLEEFGLVKHHFDAPSLPENSFIMNLRNMKLFLKRPKDYFIDWTTGHIDPHTFPDERVKYYLRKIKHPTVDKFELKFNFF